MSFPARPLTGLPGGVQCPATGLRRHCLPPANLKPHRARTCQPFPPGRRSRPPAPVMGSPPSPWSRAAPGTPTVRVRQRHGKGREQPLPALHIQVAPGAARIRARRLTVTRHTARPRAATTVSPRRTRNPSSLRVPSNTRLPNTCRRPLTRSRCPIRSSTPSPDNIPSPRRTQPRGNMPNRASTRQGSTRDLNRMAKRPVTRGIRSQAPMPSRLSPKTPRPIRSPHPAVSPHPAGRPLAGKPLVPGLRRASLNHPLRGHFRDRPQVQTGDTGAARNRSPAVFRETAYPETAHSPMRLPEMRAVSSRRGPLPTRCGPLPTKPPQDRSHPRTLCPRFGQRAKR